MLESSERWEGDVGGNNDSSSVAEGWEGDGVRREEREGEQSLVYVQHSSGSQVH